MVLTMKPAMSKMELACALLYLRKKFLLMIHKKGNENLLPCNFFV